MPLHFDIELDPLTYVVDVRRETTGFNCAPTDTGGEDPIQRLYRQSGGFVTTGHTAHAVSHGHQERAVILLAGEISIFVALPFVSNVRHGFK